MKKFHITAVCVPEKHYMVDISAKIAQIEELISQGEYFTINRARQYGKTTMFSALSRKLKDRYLVIRLSFEGVGDKFFENDTSFVLNFIRQVGKGMKKGNAPEDLINCWADTSDFLADEDPFMYLSEKITVLCDTSETEVLLMIDEVDKSSDNQIFLHFLGILRNKYLEHMDSGEATFKSVILAGVYDIKNMKLQLRPEEEEKYNSPWNIAVDFQVDMSFSPDEIQTMLQEYEADYHTGMNMTEISREIYKYTSGYPYLVSAICKWIDEQGDKIWTVDNVVCATKYIVNHKSTLIDSLIKNYENHLELQSVIDRMILEGYEFPFTRTDAVVDLGVTFGIFSGENGILRISNKIFEIILYNHIIMKNLRTQRLDLPLTSQFIQDGKLDMEQVLIKFQELRKAEYRQEDEKIIFEITV